MRRRRLRAFLKALRQGAVIFLTATLGVFFAIEAMPEDPVSLRVKNPDPQRVTEIRQSLGLEDPLAVRYLRSVRDFVTLDWGESLISGRPVRAEVARCLPATLELAGLGLFLGTGLGMAMVLFAHASGWRWMQQPLRAVAALGLTVPLFWIGILLILLFAVRLGWLPVGGRFDFAHPAPSGSGFLLFDSLRAGDPGALAIALRHLLLPVFTLALYPLAMVAATLEARLQEPSVQRMVLALQARGYGPLRIWGKHVLSVLSAPLITVIGTQAGALAGGAVLTETVYSWPGMGRLIVDGVLSRDVFIIQNGLLLVIALTVLATSLADWLAGLLHPQLQTTPDASR